jgi:hypothetical protein
VIDAIGAHLRATSAAGHGDDDMAAIVAALRR